MVIKSKVITPCCCLAAWSVEYFCSNSLKSAPPAIAEAMLSANLPATLSAIIGCPDWGSTVPIKIWRALILSGINLEDSFFAITKLEPSSYGPKTPPTGSAFKESLKGICIFSAGVNPSKNGMDEAFFPRNNFALESTVKKGFKSSNVFLIFALSAALAVALKDT